MSNPTCPYCQTAIAYDTALAGEFAACPKCSGSFYMPHLPQSARPEDHSNRFAENTHSSPFANASFANASAAPLDEPPALITVPVLLSAIWNLIMGTAYVATCFGAIVGIPMLALAVVELRTSSNARLMRPNELAERAQLLGAFEIIAGLFNGAGIVFGVLTFVGGIQLGGRSNASV